MTPPPYPTPTGLSVVRNVAQGMRLVLELPENQSISIVLSRATLERWTEQLLTGLLLLEHEHRRHGGASTL